MSRAIRRYHRRRVAKKRIQELELDFYESYIKRWGILFNWTPEEIKEMKRKDIRRMKVGGVTPGRFTHREPDYTGQRFVLRDKLARIDLQNQSNEFGAISIRLPRRTRRDIT